MALSCVVKFASRVLQVLVFFSHHFLKSESSDSASESCKGDQQGHLGEGGEEGHCGDGTTDGDRREML